MSGITPTQRTLKKLRDDGYTAGIVERFISIPGSFGKRIDLFNIIDIIAIKKGEIWGVQSCGQAFADHDKKILEHENSPKWIEAGGILLLIGWRKLKKVRGGKAMIWVPREKIYTKEDFDEQHKLAPLG